MSESRSTGHRIRSGLWTPSDVGSAYEVEALPMQPDQNDAAAWCIDASGTTTPKPARVVQNADLSISEDGFVGWTWRCSYFTNGMLSYWLATFLPGGVRSAPVTAMTYDETDAPVFYQALIIKPDFPSADAQYAIGGYGNLLWKFVRGVRVFP